MLCRVLLGRMHVGNNQLVGFQNQPVCIETFPLGASLHKMMSHNHVLKESKRNAVVSVNSLLCFHNTGRKNRFADFANNFARV